MYYLPLLIITWVYPSSCQVFLSSRASHVHVTHSHLSQPIVIDNTLTEEDLDGIIEEVDEDGSGTMDFDEFQEMMMG